MSADANTTFVKFPFSEAQISVLTATDASQTVLVNNPLVIIDGLTNIATVNRTIVLTIDPNLEAGAMIWLKAKTNGAETTTFSTGFTAATITGSAGVTYMQAFIYDGATFKPVGAEANSGAVSFNYGTVLTRTLTAADAAQTVSITTSSTIIDGVTNPASTNRTLNLSVASHIAAGAFIFLKTKTLAAQTTIFGTDFSAPTILGEAGVTFVQGFIYDGTNFLALGAPISDAVGFNYSETVTLSLSATGAQALTIANNSTIVNGVTTQATGNRTLNLTIGATLQTGATLFVKSKTAAVETTVFGTNFIAPTITGEAGKTFVQTFIYDGTNFLPVGAALKID